MDYDEFDFTVGCVLVMGREVPGCTTWCGAAATTCYDSNGGACRIAERERGRSGGALRGGTATAPGRRRAARGSREKEEGLGLMRHVWLGLVITGPAVRERGGHNPESKSAAVAARSFFGPCCSGPGPATHVAASDEERKAITFLTYDLDVHL